MPTDIKFDDLAVMYWLINPIRFKIFDYDKFIRNLDVKACHQDNSILQCSCEASDIIDKCHQHIVIGDLRKMKKNLWKVPTTGPKYRKQQHVMEKG